MLVKEATAQFLIADEDYLADESNRPVIDLIDHIDPVLIEADNLWVYACVVVATLGV